MNKTLTPRQLNKELNDEEIYWLRFEDGSQLRVYRAISRYGGVYVQTFAGWRRADQLEHNGENFTMTAESKPEKDEPFFRFDRKPPEGGQDAS